MICFILVLYFCLWNKKERPRKPMRCTWTGCGPNDLPATKACRLLPLQWRPAAVGLPLQPAWGREVRMWSTATSSVSRRICIWLRVLKENSRDENSDQISNEQRRGRHFPLFSRVEKPRTDSWGFHFIGTTYSHQCWRCYFKHCLISFR